MSLILDALRKSERTRQQSLTGQLGMNEMPAGVSRMPVPWIPILAAILVLNALLLFFFWPKAESPAVPAAAAAPASPPAYHPDVRPLAAEADAGGPPVPAPAPASRFTPPGNPSAVAAVPAVRAAAAATPVQSPVQSLDSLPPDLRQALPPLHLDVLAYARDPAQRFVVINLQRYQPGDLLPEGLKLVDIQPHGAVLDFHGTTFLLPAN